MCTGGGSIVSVSGFVALSLLLSVSRTVKLAMPVADGAPLIIPVEGARVRPAGRVPAEIDHVNGETPPDTVRVAE
jgi:hypothetical protein